MGKGGMRNGEGMGGGIEGGGRWVEVEVIRARLGLRLAGLAQDDLIRP